MAEWRFLRPWSESELAERLAALAALPLNFSAEFSEMTTKNGWTVDGSDSALGFEVAGPPAEDGLFERAMQGITRYVFSDPRIVQAYFNPALPLPGRNMLLELKVFPFHFLAGVRVHEVQRESDDRRTIFGFRYDTLEGHIERGAEWFVLTKDHSTGEVRFRIEARWRLGDLPAWWMRLGFTLFGEPIRTMWRNRASRRLREYGSRPVEKLSTARFARAAENAENRRTL
jgi:uncharacterized protein (UPF0548 family)